MSDDHTATTEDAARVIYESLTGGDAENFTFADCLDAAEAVRIAGLLATARPDTTTEPTDAQVAAAAVEFENRWNEGVKEAAGDVVDPDAFIRGVMRAALHAAWTEAGQ